MAGRQTVIRTLHDAGLAAWFGGSLFGAVGLNGAAAAAKDPSERTRISSAGWAKWAPVNAVALAAHTVGGVGLIVGNSGRIVGQKGAGTNTVVKAVITLAAMGVTGYSGLQGVKLGKNSPAAAEGTTEPSAQTPEEAAAAQRKLKYLQWAIPALTGVLLVMTAQQGEQQKPSEIVKGLLGSHR
ncbi:hypothetical protein [Kineococcus radiotolerans]|uniref:Integral membrane protein n=1 Tax=Kineococcus radiotolerans (strain ATCC BAA-149 / DSM 14245 / SRS30216) TaxID=266940 RepID=A6W663_KINRD|nr:hypothetical protein [Kineococcus radiotolerans]ABS02302.1 conserved hypothetical protein [Kineococcus radiotolerans SRS30216 = ATCC BAA-149]